MIKCQVTCVPTNYWIPPPPAVAPAGGGWGNRGSRHGHRVGLGRAAAGVAMEVKMASVWCLSSARFPSRGGSPWSSIARRLTSPSPPIYGSGALVVPRPDPRWWRIRRLKTKVKMTLASIVTKTAFLRVGSVDPAVGDFQPATGLAPIQGLRRSSGSGAPSTAPVRRPSRDIEEGVMCNFLLLLGLSVKTMD